MSAVKRMEEAENVPSFEQLLKRRPPAKVFNPIGTVIAIEEDVIWYNDRIGSTKVLKPGDRIRVRCVECHCGYWQEIEAGFFQVGDKLPERGLCPECEHRPAAQAALERINDTCHGCVEACDRACGCMWELFERELIRVRNEAMA